MFWRVLPERDQVTVVVKMDGVLDVLPVLGVLRIGVSVVAHLHTHKTQSRS